MTIKQKLLKILYPLFNSFNQIFKKKMSVHVNRTHDKPTISIFDLPVTLINGKQKPLTEWKGKKLLFVNTASDCGYTAQYAELQKLYELSKEDLVIIAFPANDFKRQEKRSNEEIARFCKRNYGVSFPVTQKAVVVKKKNQHPIFQWLTSKEQNGWNDQQPTWNFSKYLLNEEGVLTHFFGPSISPISNEMLQAINE